MSAGPSIGAGSGGAKIGQEIPSGREPAPDVDRICPVVCAFYGAERPDILKARRGRLNEPRNTATCLVRKLRRDTLSQIVRALERSIDSTVSSGCADEEKACERTGTV